MHSGLLYLGWNGGGDQAVVDITDAAWPQWRVRHDTREWSLMARFGRFHRFMAIVVLIAATAWVVSGKFSAVGSETANGAEPVAVVPAPAAPVLRTVAAMTPVFADHAREIRVAGVTEADKKAVLAARSNGIVAALAVVQGADVAGGALVMRLDGADATAAVARAQSALTQATEQLDVGEKLFARGSLAELEITARRATKTAAEAALSEAQATADRLILNAPFAGIVDQVTVEQGEWVQAGAPITTILSLDPIVVKAEVSELDVGDIIEGGAAKVRLVNGAELQGKVLHVAHQASEQTRTFVIEVALPNPARTIPSGMTAEVRLLVAAQPAVVVPRSVITLSDAGVIGLRVVGADDLAQFVPITLLDDTEAGLVVTGVPQAVRIITAGQDLVRDGDKVIVVEQAAVRVTE
jgi:membrane fusion protein, multidrug efflux system